MNDLEKFLAEAAQLMQAGRSRPVLKMFQFQTLPEEVFQNHPALIQELEKGEAAIMPLLHAWSMATIRCAQLSGRPPQMEADEEVRTQNELFSKLSVQAHKGNGYTVHVVTMPEPQSPPEAYFAAIVFKDDEPKAYRQSSLSTRYFTLEKSLGGTRFLGEYRSVGTRRNCGELEALDENAFVRAVFERIARADGSKG